MHGRELPRLDTRLIFYTPVGHWSEDSNSPGNLSVSPYATEPADRIQVLAVYAELKESMTNRGPTAEEFGELDAPRTGWTTDGIDINVDCFWSSDVIGVIQIGLQPESHARND
jgi:hypothetical protein